MQGDPEDRAYQAGPLVGLWLLPMSLYVELRGGLTRWRYADGSGEFSPYAAFTLYREF